MKKSLWKWIIYILYFPFYGILYFFVTGDLILNDIFLKTDERIISTLIITCIFFALILQFVLKLYNKQKKWLSVTFLTISLVIGSIVVYYSFLYTLLISYALVMRDF